MKKIKYFIYAAIIYLCICGESPAMEMMSDNEMGSIVSRSHALRGNAFWTLCVPSL
jgi:hypothetical protein